MWGLFKRMKQPSCATIKVCIALAKNPTHHSRTKHIDVQHHFIREKLESDEINLEYCPTEDMLADVLTKALAKDRHQRLAKALGLREGDYSQSGSVGPLCCSCMLHNVIHASAGPLQALMCAISLSTKLVAITAKARLKRRS